ncbi:DUF2155 domain-containing protein [uncultured Roseovarius sp.]|uniref:DUF2155 domain-containing protein n=1 Tax=uncultured Roseovarius sp. TaxID=293344 RepID=UPI00262051AA|nr:DUF2155 domain-containing protein [uncultured Roseovarius sp.]
MRAALGLSLWVCLAATAGTAQEQAAVGQGAVLRGLDKVNGQAQDIELANGEATEFGGLTVRLGECRYPQENPEGDAYAFVTISERERGREVFSGWMLASSPALNALEHPRYDVWVLRCNI